MACDGERKATAKDPKRTLLFLLLFKIRFRLSDHLIVLMQEIRRMRRRSVSASNLPSMVSLYSLNLHFPFFHLVILSSETFRVIYLHITKERTLLSFFLLPLRSSSSS